MNKYSDYLDYCKKIHDINMSIAVLNWDLETKMPKNGHKFRAQQISTLRKISHELSTNKSYGDLLNKLKNNNTLDFDQSRNIDVSLKKYNKTLTAYRWKAPKDTFASYWMIDGTEINHQLKNSPIRVYEQVTSLLKDGRGHKGMDWKAPVGTPTYAPKSARVTRVNFGNFKYNGNCVELKFSDGTLAKYLHLEKASVKEGQTVKVGDTVGYVGNTGRSTAPHLHYQLNKGSRVLDPVQYHGTYRRKIQDADVVSFLSDIGPIINAMDSQVIAER